VDTDGCVDTDGDIHGDSYGDRHIWRRRITEGDTDAALEVLELRARVGTVTGALPGHGDLHRCGDRWLCGYGRMCGYRLGYTRRFIWG